MAEFELPETPDSPESHKERVVGLIIAVIAVVLAIVTHLTSEIDEDKILAHVDASDQYNFYQAKRMRRELVELQSDILTTQADTLSPAGRAKVQDLTTKYGSESKRLEDEGKDIQKEGDNLMADSKRLTRQGSVLEIGEIALQISIVICSLTILTEQGLFVRIGVVIAGAGVVVAISSFIFFR